VTRSEWTHTRPLPPPALNTVEEYAARLEDPAFWAPYVCEILQRHGLPTATPTLGTVGSFPTFLVGQYVVKLYGERFEGAICYQSERTVLRLLREQPAILAPALIADGALFDTAGAAGGEAPILGDTATGQDWPWPYLVMTRLPGISWHQARLGEAERHAVARQLGAIVRQLHALTVPAGPLVEPDRLSAFRHTCVERLRRYGELPEHLIGQVDAYLLPPRPERRLVHADLHSHHLLVDGGRLVGIIDWGDAFATDPYYELPALYLNTFNGDKRLLRAFLDGYGWPADPDFARQAMTMTLMFEFNALHDVAAHIDLREIATLDELADRVWAL
jgi:hygromycin-B 7''-O-kinase